MEIRSSLKRKSIFALAVYLCFIIATIGTVSYLVVEPPLRFTLEQNLDSRTELLAAQVVEPLNSSMGILQSIVSIGQSGQDTQGQDKALRSLFSVINGVTVSGGLWPKPYSVRPDTAYASLFYNRTEQGHVDRVYSWNNPQSGGYDRETWYITSASAQPGSIAWSRVYIDPYTHIQMLTASSPYFVNGAFAGVATVDLSLNSLIDFVSRMAEDHQLGVFLRDAYGDAITEHNFRIAKGVYISELSFGDFRWQMDVVNAQRRINDEVYQLVSQVEFALLPILLLCVMLGYYLLNRYLLKPIVLIAQEVDASREGGIIDMDYRSQDEIRHLIDSFNQKTVYLEAEKVKAQASTKAKSAFLATLSHEIRTPMNGVLGTAQILLKSDLTDEQRKYMKSLYESGDHMMTLLNEILDFSKIEQGHLELEHAPFPLDSIIGSINSVYHTLCFEKGLQFKVFSEVEPGRWYLSDKARIRQVLFNLLNNAVKFTSLGFVEVYLKEVEMNDKTYLSVKVRDTGIGIAKEAQRRIFKPFEQAESSTTRRFGGTGLGLAIVKQICELMDGDVTVVSEEGIGSNFDVLIAVEPCEPGTVEVETHSKLDYTGLRCLIVEDNRTNTIIMETFMRSKGFICDCVENGERAVRQLLDKHYDLILMDNHMPVMDGVEAIKAIRQLQNRKARTLIFGCTADVFKETQQRMMNAGANHIVAKPIDENELDDALYRYSPLLYQFVSEATSQQPSVVIHEESLVALYVDIENHKYQDARLRLNKIKQVLGVQLTQPAADVIERVGEALDNQSSPLAEDLDLLAVLLSDFCN